MAYTKEEMIAALEKAVGDTEKGKEIIAKAEQVYGETGKYSQDMVDRLHDAIGGYKGVIEHDTKADKPAEAAADAEKMAVVEKALAALEALDK
ncbi:MAG: FRAT-87 protein [Eubacteriaceae bacterium]|jgi:hypothetical protein